MMFEIITTAEVAGQIKKQFEFDEKHKSRSIKLKNIKYEGEYATVQVENIGDNKIEPSDIFWLGYFSAYSFKK